MPGTEPSDDRTGGSDGGNSEDPPEAVVDEAERLTRLARDAVDDSEAAAYRDARADLLAEYGYTARVREEGRDTLVLHPAEWVVDGTVRPERVEDTGRGIERPLEGPGEAEEWEVVAEHNREVAEAVAAAHGEIHGANARALAEFASNHYAKPVGDLAPEERAEFLEEYFPRNAFPSDDQKAVVEESVRLVYDGIGNR